MSLTGDNIQQQVNAYIRNYAVDAFHDMNLNRILLQIIAWIDSGGTTGPVVSPNMMTVTSANFTTQYDCPIPSLNGQSLAIMWNDIPKPLVKGTDWSDFPGGGFTMLDPAFDKSAGTYTFWVFITT